jgi:hypothetical protein
MTGEGFTLAVLYRMVYGRTRDRLSVYYVDDPPEAIRAEPLQGLTINPVVLADPEAAETIREAVEDALACRRPRW